ncbi:MAG: TolC family protein [Candidatus Caenarcaniphilales bacterium]|nr:TolC family protein [Candidatus Caenarcaniphilales bacterium]
MNNYRKIFLTAFLATNFFLPALAVDTNLKIEDDIFDYSISSYLKTIKVQKSKLEDLFKVPKFKLEANYSESVTVSFEDILAKAIENNLNLNIAKQNSKIAKWNYYSKFGDALPDIILSANYQKREGTFYLNSNFANTIDEGVASAGFRVNYRLFNGGTTLFLLLAEKYYRRATEAQEKASYNLVLLEGSELFFDLIREKMALATKLKILEQAKANHALALKFVNAGTGTKYDLLQTEARLARVEQDLINEQANLRLSQIALASHLNMPLYTPIDLAEELVPQLKIVDESLEINEFIKTAFEQNPNILAAIEARKAAYKEAYSTVGDFLPKVDIFYDVTGGGEDFGNLNKINTIGFASQYNIGDGLGLNAASHYKESRNKAQRAQLLYEQEMQSIEKGLRISFINYQKSKSLLEASFKELNAAQEALRLARLRYENGVEILTNLVSREKELSEAEFNLIDSTISYNTAQLRLLYNMGSLSVEKLLAGRING